MPLFGAFEKAISADCSQKKKKKENKKYVDLVYKEKEMLQQSKRKLT